jgi:CrcB protein
VNLLLVLGVAVAGGIGAGLRYAVDQVVRTRRFPFGILIVNVTGSFVLGLITGAGSALAPDAALVLGVGLLGGYTTFSTVSVETVLLAERGRWRDAAANLLGTLALAAGAAAGGIALGAAVAGALA